MGARVADDEDGEEVKEGGGGIGQSAITQQISE
jgi:hypothetical protein